MPDQVLGDRDLADHFVEPEDVVAVEQGLDRLGLARGRLLDDGDLVILGQVVDDHVEHEPVELGLGERIRPFHLDRVLGGQDEEGFFERVATPAAVTWCSCMASSKAA